MKQLSLAMDVYLYTGSSEKSYIVEITEDYEGDKFHVVTYDAKSPLPHDHWETIGLDNEKDVFDYLRRLRN